jgi:nitrogenase molybdenum-iron protein alpha/beta subunit
LNLVAEFGIKILGFGTNEFSNECGSKYVENICSQHGNFRMHLSSWQPSEYANIFPREKPDLIFGDICVVAWGLRQGFPGYGIFIHTFFFGYDGAINIAREIVKALKNPSLVQGFASHTNFPYKKSWYSESPSKYLIERRGDRVEK